MRKRSHPRAVVLLSVLLVIGIAGTGCFSSTYARQRDADRQLSARVGEQLAAVPVLSTAKVAARSHRGVVALLGEVPDEDSKLEAERIAGAVPGVARVDNMILVVKGDSRAEGSAPAGGALILARTN